ncbi:MAG: selenide, water dikinase SelD [Rhodoferax sp.]|nr:selenide, water dikinase SelD [Rhodoferax sp.]MCF8209373.1 selenide, water dikinase SelD [Rhodoferax sp.]
MQKPTQPIARDIVLIGGGHSHVGVLKRWGMQPEPGVRLTVICTDVHTPYSGMLPGYIADHYSYDEVHIDLARLAGFAGARLYCDEVTGIDRAAQKVLCSNRPPVPYDFLSINIGSTPRLNGVAGAAAHATPVKPITRFNARWLALLARVQQHTHGLLRVAVVGAGAGGVELILSMQYRLRQELQTRGHNPNLLEFHILSASDSVLPTHNPRVRHKFARVLAERGVQVHLKCDVIEVQPGQLRCANGTLVPADETMWVTQAVGAPWLQSTGLALNDGGFIRVNDQLQSVSDGRIFAAGDIAAMDQHPLEKAGVFAVRMGPPLADNLRLSVRGQALKAYHPQSKWLALISTGDKFAVASRGALGFWGPWVWRWKDHIDRSFMRKFSEFGVMQSQPAASTNVPSQLALNPQESLQALSALAMRCGGCGAKVGATVLSRALGQLQVLNRPDVLIGLNDPDDAAVVRVPAGKALVHSVDFFRAFVDDPYLFGKVAANHALGDIFAMGAEPQSATAIATVPPGLEAKVEDLLFQMMCGAVEVLNAAGCALVGGHTGEGSELALGFAVNGLLDEHLVGVTRKSGMQAGDMLILTKPIGTGTLFAAHARLAARGRWIDAALQSMVQSNQLGAQCLREFGATACTDLTGFGLLGHLVEMTKPSGVDAELVLSALPLLEGAEETVAAGIVSSLQPANARLRRALRNLAQFAKHPRYPLIFDPQTAGGLLASVPAHNVNGCVLALKKLGYVHTAIIGRIVAQGEAIEPVLLLN